MYQRINIPIIHFPGSGVGSEMRVVNGIGAVTYAVTYIDGLYRLFPIGWIVIWAVLLYPSALRGKLRRHVRVKES